MIYHSKSRIVFLVGVRAKAPLACADATLSLGPASLGATSVVRDDGCRDELTNLAPAGGVS